MWFKRSEGRDKNAILAARQAVVESLEAERGTRVIPLIHRREPWDKNGEDEQITIEDSEFILMRIRETPKEQPLDLIVHTPGGLALAAEMIAMALAHHRGKVTVMVPFYAMSGGTLIALAAGEIRMENYSVLGPVDPQIAGWPSGSLIRILDRKRIEAIQDETVILSDIARMAVQNMKGFVRRLLQGKMAEAQAEVVAEFLTGGYLTHDTPITLAVARQLGLNAIEGVPAKVYELFSTCEFGVCKRPCLASYAER